MLLFIIAGLATGSVYGIAGVGLVLTYKSAGIFNFAHGALATVSAYLYYFLHVEHGVAWPIAVALCVLVAAPVIGFGFELLARPLAGASLATQVVATVGVLLAVQSTVVLIYGVGVPRSVPQFLPDSSLSIAGAKTSWSTVVIIALGVGVTTALWLFFRRARSGIAMRAVVDNPDLVELTGTNSRAVRRGAWVIGVMLASVSGLLLAPLINLDGITLTLLVIQAFGAAAIGRFRSLPLTYAGGLGIGVAASLVAKYATSGWLSNLPSALPFLVLFVVLLLTRRARAGEGGPAALRAAVSGWRAPAAAQIPGAVALLVLLALVPDFAGYHLGDWMNFLPMVILFLSLGLLVRTSGQVSLASVTFMAIGACAFAHLITDHHWPWLLGLFAAGLVAVPIGALLAIPAIRLSGLFLALATLGFGITVSYVFYSESYMFGTLGLGITAHRPKLGGADFTSDRNFYYLLLVVTVLIALGVVALTRGRLGRLLRAISDSPRGLSGSGTSINVTRVLVFGVSAFLAGIAGALTVASQGIVTADAFQPLQSLTFFVVVVIAIGDTPWYAVIAAAGTTLLPSYLNGSPTTTAYLNLAFGFFAVCYAITPPSRRGVPPFVAAKLERLRRTSSTRPAATNSSSDRFRTVPAELDVTGLRVAFGGLIAVDGLDLNVATGSIVALIGPNGAGKTTTFDAVSGFTPPSGGQVRFDGHDLRRIGAASRARRGLGRTFQRMELFDSMTVRENVALGYEGSRATSNPLRHLLSRRRSRRDLDAATTDALELCGVDTLAARPVADLSTGQRRLVELARCLAGPFRILLLDEPSSGLDRVETARFADVVRQVVAQRHVGVLIVEHDMDLIVGMADRVYVLDFGKLIFHGTPQEMRRSVVVRAAYFGDERAVTV